MKIMRIKDWGFFYKIFGINLLTMAALILLIVTYILPTMRFHLMEEKELAVKSNTEIAYSVIKHFETMHSKGELTKELAQKYALEEISALRFDGDNYFWINDLSYNMVVHGAKPELNGKDMTGFKDPDGKEIFVEFVNTGKKIRRRIS